MRSGAADGGRAGALRLSRREHEVAALVAEGLTDQAIAQRLFLSVRTVEGHVRSILNKLGLDNRSQVAAWFTRDQLTSASATPSTPSLPQYLTTFFGREEELSGVGLLLQRARGITITGPGGVGKTRFAIRVAESLAARFTGGTWFVDLSPTSDPDAVVPEIAAALGVRERDGTDLLASIGLRLGGEQRRHCLVVLDNCEQIVDRCSSVAESLLQSCPHLSVLCTSREPLLFDGEVVWKLLPLRLPPVYRRTSADIILDAPAVRLFRDRAALSDPVFELTDGNAETVARLCRHLDGIPLALELAAAQVGPLGLEGVVERLAERLDFLHRRSGAPRHRTLATAIRWSYDLLEEPAQILLRRLSVFRGGFTESAARFVCGDVADLVPVLAEKSLILQADGARRWTMLETIRQFAAEVLAAGDGAEAVRDQHVRFFFEYAGRAESALAGPGQAEWLTDLERERDNLRAALEASRQGDPELTLRFVLALHRFWLLRGHLSEGRAWLEEALANAETVSATSARALNALAGVVWRQGDYTRARQHLQESLRRWRTLGDESGVQRCLANLGVLAAGQADFEAARAYDEESLDVARRIGDPWPIAIVQGNLGLVEAELGNHERAQTLLERAHASLRALDDQAAAATTLVNQAILALNRKRPQQAAELYVEALSRFRPMGETPETASCLEGLGWIAAFEGRAEMAVRLAGAAAGVREALGTPLSPAARGRLERWLPAARRELGRAAEAAWEAGKAMPAAEAVELVLRVTA